jgi:RNA polymerase sigma factor (sigma-70 family)
VDDLVQQVFMGLTQHLDKGGVENPDAYIFKTASNTLKNYRRREENRGRVINHHLDQITELDEIETDFSPERVLIGEERLNSAFSVLRQLPARTRQVYVLCAFQGLKYMDIARLLNISERSVKRHISKALEALCELQEPKP